MNCFGSSKGKHINKAEIRAMSHTAINQKIIRQLNNLPVELQIKALEFLNALAASKPQGGAGKDLLRFAGSIPSKELIKMKQAIEDGCERVDIDEW